VIETPLPASQYGVGWRPNGAEPETCEPMSHLDIGGAPTIFWGSYEPEAGYLLPMGAAPSP